jgi:hypothetical protein
LALPSVYRYDAEEFEDGRLVTSRGDHIKTLFGREVHVENALRSVSAEQADIRATSLYVWRDREVAERLWRLTRNGEHLYELEVQNEDVRFVGDVSLYTLAKDVRDDELAINALVREYWRSTILKPTVEILVSRAKIIRRVFNNHEK